MMSEPKCTRINCTENTCDHCIYYHEYADIEPPKADGWKHPDSTVHEFVDDMPSTDVRENIHGEWKGGAFCGCDMYGEAIIAPITCSECKYEVEEVSNFCPNCGADMRGESK